jgi:hypothetical protein
LAVADLSQTNETHCEALAQTDNRFQEATILKFSKKDLLCLQSFMSTQIMTLENWRERLNSLQS